MPAFSIITPLYNKGPYIEETIRSAQAQTLTNWEIIVVDNGSTDDGPERVRRFAADDHRVRLWSSGKRGPGAARNFGLTQATGEWVLFLDADDLIEADYLQTQLAAATEHPEADIIAGLWQEFRDGDVRDFVFHKPGGLGQSRCQLLDHAIAFTCWAVHAAIIRRAALGTNGAWPEELDRYLAEDTVFWFRLVDAHKVAYSRGKGALYRTQTPGCRTQSQVVEAWFAGLHAAAVANVAWLEQHGRVLTHGQAESLFRLYAGLYAQAISQSARTLAESARQNAEHWLAQRNRSGAPPASWGIRCARVLGVSTFLKFKVLREWFRRPAPIHS